MEGEGIHAKVRRRKIETERK
uniref:Uncharacterized protein n=1 Tax=Anguilla anguilla TaxID=7936 RepID=A0A0E9R9Z6_ANGAN